MAVGDRLFLTPPDTINEALIYQGAAVTAKETVTIKIRNVSADKVGESAETWSYLIVKP